MRSFAPNASGAVIVTRVSSGTQLKGTSLEDQLDVCRAKAGELSLPIIAEYEDAGVSGAYLLLRSGMQMAIADIKERRADTLICATFDRYSRDEEHQHRIKREVTQAGGRIVFCDMDFDESPEGELNFTIQGGFKAYERKVIRARMLKGKRRRAMEGQQPARSRSPYGYVIVTRAHVIRGEYPADQLGRYHIDPEKAPVARRIFESYAAGAHSLPKIAKELNYECVAPPGSRNIWHEATIRLILSNPVYKGKPVSGRIKTAIDEGRLQQAHPVTGHPLRCAEVRYLAPEEKWIRLSAPPLVSEEVWNAVQDRLKVMCFRQGGNPRRVRMLTGLVFCPHCGNRAITKYQVANGKKYSYYYCGLQSRMKRMTGQRPCSPDLYPIAEVEEATLIALREACRRPEAVAAALEAYRAKGSQPSDADDMREELGALDKGLGMLRREEQAAIQAQIAGMRSGASPDAYAEVFADIAMRRKDMEDRRGLITKAIGRASGAKRSARAAANDLIVRQALEDADRVLSDPDVPGLSKRNLLGTIVQKVVCRKEGADVILVPGALTEAGNQAGTRDTFYTTCIGINTQK